jgi:hypothetical protein
LFDDDSVLLPTWVVTQYCWKLEIYLIYFSFWGICQWTWISHRHGTRSSGILAR